MFSSVCRLYNFRVKKNGSTIGLCTIPLHIAVITDTFLSPPFLSQELEYPDFVFFNNPFHVIYTKFIIVLFVLDFIYEVYINCLTRVLRDLSISKFHPMIFLSKLQHLISPFQIMSILLNG